MFFSLSIDFFFLGFSIREAIRDWFRPFSPLIISEKIILIGYPLSIIIFLFLKQKGTGKPTKRH
ncbi:hypothetical protein ACFFMO_20985 [Lederbergia wuyishanensis]